MAKFIVMFLLIANVLYADTVFAEPKPNILEPRKIVFSIKSADDEEINHVLSAANNVLKFYGPENVKMRIVAYYHGIKSLLKSEVETSKRISALMQLDVEFVACGNTMRTKNIKEEALVDDVEIVTAGIVEMMERVKEGWIYIAP
ncbi:DsrE family protein [Sulfurimonas sp.]|uniref:DsrE family protein n=1 Tax=Sulfurimonas sp. TaxID=2022749 RepID=UPI0019E25F07|nr:DsrE family protein [Sulfurimonas sp.]MBE0514241.1 DsrE family protein [Sulfurimonas sp.]